ncbi:MAG: hypothetical protein Q9181_001895 [Wetmoreana brouardii]
MYSIVFRVLALVLFPLYASCLYFPSLSAPSRFHHNITVPSVGELRINCYVQPPLPARRLPDADIQHCYTTLQYLLRGDKAMAPMHFTVDKTGFQVPFAWGHNTCQIIINNVIPHASGNYPFVMLAHLAAEVMEACVLESPARLGGEVRLGSQDQFEILVSGTGLKTGDWGVIEGERGAPVGVESRDMPLAVEVSR